MGEKQQTQGNGPTVHISVFIPSGDGGIVPARGIFTAAVPMTPEIREFLGSSVDQSAWSRQAVQERVSWHVVEAELGDPGGTNST